LPRTTWIGCEAKGVLPGAGRKRGMESYGDGQGQQHTAHRSPQRAHIFPCDHDGDRGKRGERAAGGRMGPSHNRGMDCGRGQPSRVKATRTNREAKASVPPVTPAALSRPRACTCTCWLLLESRGSPCVLSVLRHCHKNVLRYPRQQPATGAPANLLVPRTRFCPRGPVVVEHPLVYICCTF
jgi:hypothetical protein